MSSDFPWRAPGGREARNEQRKLRGVIANTLAITLLITAFAGPYINPTLEQTLSAGERIGMAFLGVMAHYLARFFVRGMEDK